MIKVKDDCPKEEVELLFASLKVLIEEEKNLSDNDYPTYFAWGKVIGAPDTYCCSTGWGSVGVSIKL